MFFTRDEKPLSEEEVRSYFRGDNPKSFSELSPLDLSELPKFPSYAGGGADPLRAVLPDMAVLALANVVFLLFALNRFLRSDFT